MFRRLFSRLVSGLFGKWGARGDPSQRRVNEVLQGLCILAGGMLVIGIVGLNIGLAQADEILAFGWLLVVLAFAVSSAADVAARRRTPNNSQPESGGEVASHHLRRIRLGQTHR